MLTYILACVGVLIMVIAWRIVPKSGRDTAKAWAEICKNYAVKLFKGTAKALLIGLAIAFLVLILGGIVHAVAIAQGNQKNLLVLGGFDLFVVVIAAIFASVASGQNRIIVRGISLLGAVIGLVLAVIAKGPAFYADNFVTIWLCALGLVMLLFAGFYFGKPSNKAMYIVLGLFAFVILSCVALPTKWLAKKYEVVKLQDEQAAVNLDREMLYGERDVQSSQAQVVGNKSGRACPAFQKSVDSHGKVTLTKVDTVALLSWVKLVGHGEPEWIHGESLVPVALDLNNDGFCQDSLLMFTNDLVMKGFTEAVVPEVKYEPHTLVPTLALFVHNGPAGFPLIQGKNITIIISDDMWDGGIGAALEYSDGNTSITLDPKINKSKILTKKIVMNDTKYRIKCTNKDQKLRIKYVFLEDGSIEIYPMI